MRQPIQVLVIDAREHDAWPWCGFEEALGLCPWPESREALRQANVVLDRQEDDRAACARRHRGTVPCLPPVQAGQDAPGKPLRQASQGGRER